MSQSHSKPHIRPGEYLMRSDRSGRRMWSSEARREWTGMIVHKDEWEERHPQDFVTGKVDRQAVPVPRPDPIPVFGGPLTTDTTADVAAGANTLPVVSSARFFPGDTLHISTDSGQMWIATVQGIPDATSLGTTTGAPGFIGSGRKVINVTAISPADVG